MTNEEKITHIRTAAMEEARAEANAIVKQHEDALRSVFEQHQIEARRQSETRVRAESVTAKQQLNMAMSKAQLELKREMGKIQTELKTELFEEVQLKLKKAKDNKNAFYVFPRQGSSAFTKPAVLGSLNYDIIDINICQDFFTVFTEISPEFRTS